MGRGNRGRILKGGHHAAQPSPNHQLIQTLTDRQPKMTSRSDINGQGANEQGRGGINSRGAGLQIRGHGRRNRKAELLLKHIILHDKDLDKIVVKGVLESTVAHDKDYGLAKCGEWLEERARLGSRKPFEIVCMKSLRWEGDNLVFEVIKSDTWKILKLDGQQFYNVTLSVKRTNHRSAATRSLTTQDSNITLVDPVERTERFKAVLFDRYDAENKVLNLEHLATDLRLAELGTFHPTAARQRSTDFFRDLMRLCESETIFPSRATKAEQVTSISLANNDLTNLAPVLQVIRAFPDILNLDLSNNKFEDLRALGLFRHKFKRLEWLIISPNPIDLKHPEYQTKIRSLFPSLRTLNSTKIPVDEVTSTAAPDNTLPFATIKDNFQDEGGIAESAVKQLIMGTDNDRVALTRNLYDNESTFSVSYNSSAPRLDNAQSASWEPHLKQSRNLKRVTQLEPRIRRMAKGITEIEEALKIFPPTRHPDLVNESSRYSFDCIPLPGVPDPHGQLESGVGGFKVDVHGTFDEFDRNTGLKNATRSFDRVFILGPGAGEHPLRIISDILILRADGGHEVFSPAEKATSNLPAAITNLGVPTNSNTDKELNQANMTAEVSQATGLTIEWANTLLNDSGWNFQVALENFKLAKGKGVLQNQYFRPEVHALAVSDPIGIYF
ncbi:MAG: hypothetical protein Q9219_007279 [cf. Caloplaca sp. 3 TL-2023]